LTDYDLTPLKSKSPLEGDDSLVLCRRRAQLDSAKLLLELISYLTRVRQGSLHGWCIHLFEKRGAKSFANDLVEDRGVVITRAVFSMRFVESKSQDLSIVCLESWRRMHGAQ